MEIVKNIVDILKQITNEKVMVSKFEISDVSFFINGHDIKRLWIKKTTNSSPLLKIDINYNIKYLVDRIRVRGISDKVRFIVDDDMKDIRIGDVLENGKYWKGENKMINSCENKDKICKSRAECMREITNKNKFDVEEEFKKICIKERENVLERIHEEIEEKAKLGNNKTEIYLNVNYLGCDFSYLYYSSSMFYNDGTILRDDYNSFYGRRFFLSEFVNTNSYVWKFVDRLDYHTAKRISLLYVRDWIKQTLVEDEGFDVEVSEYGVFTISW